MGRVVGSETNGEEVAEESNAGKILDSSADPVVYQLVRVEGDGRLVPATDDEVIEVEHLLADEKVEIPLQQCVSIELLSSKKSDVECSEGLSYSEVTEDDSRKLNARLEYIEGMLRKVKQEERLRLSCESLHHSPEFVDVDDQSSDHPYHLIAYNDDLQVGNTSQEIAHSTGIHGSHIGQLETAGTCVDPVNEPVMSGSSVSEPSTSSKPDFPISNGEICLDSLTVRELQEVFRATFGRQTNVKDKRWLKRQIAVQFTNSSQNQATNIVIKEENLSYRVQSSELKAGSGHTDQVACQDSPPSPKHMKGQTASSSKRTRKPVLECDENNDNLLMEQSAAKRVRKPTKRFIEELSEVENQECTGRFPSAQSSSTSRFRSVRNIVSQGTVFVTRHDSLGGACIQIPYAYRVRRGRPRKNFMAFVNHHPSGMAAKLVKKALGIRVSQKVGNSASTLWKAKAIPMQVPQRNIVRGMDQGKRSEEESDSEDEQNIDLEHEKRCLSRDHSDDNADVSSSLRSGNKRNHHRAWTLNEVMQLVDGVARYGLGRWSEIKRLVFASYTYRTSVDLKDKWRNLLRASFAQGLKEKGGRNGRKHASISIPTPILMRVRELAEMQSPADDELGPCKLASSSRRLVQEKRSGFL